MSQLSLAGDGSGDESDAQFTTPPSSPHLAASRPPSPDHAHPTGPQTVVNITVNTRTAPFTLYAASQGWVRWPEPLTAQQRLEALEEYVRDMHMTSPPPRHHRAPETPSPSQSRVAPGYRHSRVPVTAPPSPSPSRRARTAADADPQAMARRMRHIEAAIAEVRQEQDTVSRRMNQDTAAPAPAPTTSQDVDGNARANRPSRISPADEHIDPPDNHARKWYVIIVGLKVGIFKHWGKAAQYTRDVPHAVYQSCVTRAEAELLYNGCKADGVLEVLQR
ncbi:hypothetical protein K466DRAFT_569962 [Polyporus arcularius HHB13444]|uniref:Ribonuclease H1 N-terminal domain-containing protein n=1 Tax=Polyporus arcularius HHB13444 TaxID=1314778 RepID=A0A5C3NT16_9APHY|nr:hypothetical protein K466DRAFT_569962 [Polyporus arcularius HHB13444]